ncbi:MAG: hypothetical protein ACMUIG_05255 [Thermoplasmatota archaeon]
MLKWMSFILGRLWGADNLKGLRTYIGMMIALILIIAVMPGRSSADDDSLVVIVILESDPVATYGDNINFRIHVFDRGVPADADDEPELTARSELYEYRNEVINITSEKIAVGVYVASLELQDREVENWDTIQVMLRNMYDAEKKYAVRVGKDTDDDNIYDYTEASFLNEITIRLDRSKNLEIKTEFKDLMGYPWGPGDRIDISVEVLLNEIRKNADDISWNIDHWEDFDPHIEITYDNFDTGLYDFYIWIPDNLTKNIDVEIGISAVIGDMEAVSEFRIPVEIFHLWSHKQPSGIAELNCNLYVSDNDGVPVKGAKIDAYYESGGEKHLTGVTDLVGKAKFVFLAHDSDEIEISGWITKEGKNQSFWTAVTVIPRSNVDNGGDVEPDEEPEYYPWPWGFDVVSIDDEPVEEDGILKMDYIAFLDGERMANRTIYYVIYDQQDRIYGYGGTITDTEGKFRVEFDKPSGWTSALIYFKGQVGYHRTVWVDLYNWRDSDSDGYSDDYEIAEGTDPRDQFDHPFLGGGRADSDWDGVCDQEENFYGTDPADPFSSPKFKPGPYDQKWTDHNSTDGFSYDYSLDIIFISSQEDLNLKSDKYAVKVTNFEVGGRTEVSVKSQNGNGGDPDHTMLYFIPGGMDDVNKLVETGETTEWTCWTDDQEVMLFQQDGSLKGIVLTPDFLPANDQEYTFLGGDFYEMNSVVVRDGQSRSAGDWDEGEDGISPFIIVIIIILAILLIAALGVAGFFGIRRIREEKARKDSEKMMEELRPEKKSIVDEIMSSDIYGMTGPTIQPQAAPPDQAITPATSAQQPQSDTDVRPVRITTQLPDTTPSVERPEVLPWEIQPSMDFFSTSPVNDRAEEGLNGPLVVEGEVHMEEEPTSIEEPEQPAEEEAEPLTGDGPALETQPEIGEPPLQEPALEETAPAEPLSERTSAPPASSGEKSRIDDLFD